MRALRVLQERSDTIRSRTQGEVLALLARAPGDASIDGLERAAVHAHAILDDEGRRALARPEAPRPACSAGCSYCCHVHVDATVPEILAIASHLRRSLTSAALGSLRARLAARVPRVEHLSDEARWSARIPCALLGEDGRCSIYDVRPLRCRAFHSCSVTPCREAFEGCAEAEPVKGARLERAHDAVEEGYDQALILAGHPADGHRLEVGLLVALEDPEAGARWLAGAAPFARARSPGSG